MKKLGWIVMAATLAVQAQVPAPVTTETLTKAQQDPNSWLSYGKNYFGWRYSPLTQITTANVSQLAPAWILPTGVPGTFSNEVMKYGWRWRGDGDRWHLITWLPMHHACTL